LMIDFLILGFGWQGTFLGQLLDQQQLTWKATTTTGRDGTIKFKFDPQMNPEEYKRLPRSKTVLVTFPLPTLESPQALLSGYGSAQWILLGSTRAFNGLWSNNKGPVEPDQRYMTEEQFIKSGGLVLNLAGLWGDNRIPKNWIDRIAPSKEKLREKGSLHLIHGRDVARLILQASLLFQSGRFIVTDLSVYDWWHLCLQFGSPTHKQWVFELMNETGLKGLPRPVSQLQRALDSTDVWKAFNLLPQEG
ncbi:hypothetical protein EDD86DRAFT_183487, partial [Gorgonomyces haynaldii]